MQLVTIWHDLSCWSRYRAMTQTALSMNELGGLQNWQERNSGQSSYAQLLLADRDYLVGSDHPTSKGGLSRSVCSPMCSLTHSG